MIDVVLVQLAIYSLSRLIRKISDLYPSCSPSTSSSAGILVYFYCWDLAKVST